MRRNVMAIMRLLVTVIVVGTLAAMVLSLREENARLRAQLSAQATQGGK